jgi:hypothetical protein
MSHKTFPTRRTIEAVQGLLDNHCERVHPKRHRTGAQKARRAKKKHARGKFKSTAHAAAKRAYDAQIRAYFAGESETRPDAR